MLSQTWKSDNTIWTYPISPFNRTVRLRIGITHRRQGISIVSPCRTVHVKLGYSLNQGSMKFGNWRTVWDIVSHEAPIVGENIIGSPKMQTNYNAIIFFSYYSIANLKKQQLLGHSILNHTIFGQKKIRVSDFFLRLEC